MAWKPGGIFRVLGGTMERVGGTRRRDRACHWHVLGVALRMINQGFARRRLALHVSDHTFSDDGPYRLWTEEDNVTRFDQLEIEALPWSEAR